MTGDTATPALLLSDKLMGVMALTNLTTRVPVFLDVDEMNYSSWTYFFQNLCRGYTLLDHILHAPDEATSSTKPPPTAEWLAIDSIILSWIFTTMSKTLQQRLVVENPKTRGANKPSFYQATRARAWLD